MHSFKAQYSCTTCLLPDDDFSTEFVCVFFCLFVRFSQPNWKVEKFRMPAAYSLSINWTSSGSVVLQSSGFCSTKQFRLPPLEHAGPGKMPVITNVSKASVISRAMALSVGSSTWCRIRVLTTHRFRTSLSHHQHSSISKLEGVENCHHSLMRESLDGSPYQRYYDRKRSLSLCLQSMMTASTTTTDG